MILNIRSTVHFVKRSESATRMGADVDCGSRAAAFYREHMRMGADGIRPQVRTLMALAVTCTPWIGHVMRWAHAVHAYFCKSISMLTSLCSQALHSSSPQKVRMTLP